MDHYKHHFQGGHYVRPPPPPPARLTSAPSSATASRQQFLVNELIHVQSAQNEAAMHSQHLLGMQNMYMQELIDQRNAPSGYPNSQIMVPHSSQSYWAPPPQPSRMHPSRIPGPYTPQTRGFAHIPPASMSYHNPLHNSPQHRSPAYFSSPDYPPAHPSSGSGMYQTLQSPSGAYITPINEDEPPRARTQNSTPAAEPLWKPSQSKIIQLINPATGQRVPVRSTSLGRTRSNFDLRAAAFYPKSLGPTTSSKVEEKGKGEKGAVVDDKLRKEGVKGMSASGSYDEWMMRVKGFGLSEEKAKSRDSLKATLKGRTSKSPRNETVDSAATPANKDTDEPVIDLLGLSSPTIEDSITAATPKSSWTTDLDDISFTPAFLAHSDSPSLGADGSITTDANSPMDYPWDVIFLEPMSTGNSSRWSSRSEARSPTLDPADSTNTEEEEISDLADCMAAVYLSDDEDDAMTPTPGVQSLPGTPRSESTVYMDIDESLILPDGEFEIGGSFSTSVYGMASRFSTSTEAEQSLRASPPDDTGDSQLLDLSFSEEVSPSAGLESAKQASTKEYTDMAVQKREKREAVLAEVAKRKETKVKPPTKPVDKARTVSGKAQKPIPKKPTRDPTRFLPTNGQAVRPPQAVMDAYSVRHSGYAMPALAKSAGLPPKMATWKAAKPGPPATVTPKATTNTTKGAVPSTKATTGQIQPVGKGINKPVAAATQSTAAAKGRASPTALPVGPKVPASPTGKGVQGSGAKVVPKAAEPIAASTQRRGTNPDNVARNLMKPAIKAAQNNPPVKAVPTAAVKATTAAAAPSALSKAKEESDRADIAAKKEAERLRLEKMRLDRIAMMDKGGKPGSSFPKSTPTAFGNSNGQASKVQPVPVVPQSKRALKKEAQEALARLTESAKARKLAEQKAQATRRQEADAKALRIPEEALRRVQKAREEASDIAVSPIVVTGANPANNEPSHPVPERWGQAPSPYALHTQPERLSTALQGTNTPRKAVMPRSTTLEKRLADCADFAASEVKPMDASLVDLPDKVIAEVVDILVARAIQIGGKAAYDCTDISRASDEELDLISLGMVCKLFRAEVGRARFAKITVSRWEGMLLKLRPESLRQIRHLTVTPWTKSTPSPLAISPWDFIAACPNLETLTVGLGFSFMRIPADTASWPFLRALRVQPGAKKFFLADFTSKPFPALETVHLECTLDFPEIRPSDRKIAFRNIRDLRISPGRTSVASRMVASLEWLSFPKLKTLSLQIGIQSFCASKEGIWKPQEEQNGRTMHALTTWCSELPQLERIRLQVLISDYPSNQQLFTGPYLYQSVPTSTHMDALAQSLASHCPKMERLYYSVIATDGLGPGKPEESEDDRVVFKRWRCAIGQGEGGSKMLLVVRDEEGKVECGDEVLSEPEADINYEPRTEQSIDS